MQKKIIALAIAGLVSGGAFAQSNVTLYGIVDVGVEIGNSGNGSKTRLQSGQSAGNRLGFKGEEALGGGTSVYFTLEQGFALDNGQMSNNSSHLGGGSGYATGNAGGLGIGVNTGSATGVQQTTGAGMFQRTAIAGLKGSWGSLSVGRQYAPEFLVTAAVDPFAAGLGGNNGVVLGGAGFAQRLDNSALYVSPSMSGFSVGLGVSSGAENNTNVDTAAGPTAGTVTAAGVATAAAPAKVTTNDKAGKAVVLMATYANGPVYLGWGYHNVNGTSWDATTTANGLAKNKSWLGAASWNFGVVKLSGTYFAGTTDSPGAAIERSTDVKAYTFGLQAPMGPFTLNAVYGKRDDKTAADKDFTSFSVGGEYALSKRTALYGAYTKFNNNDKGSAAVINTALNTGLSLSAATYDPRISRQLAGWFRLRQVLQE